MENNKEKQTIIDNLTFGTAAAPFEMKCLDSCAIEIPRGLFFCQGVLYCSGKLPFLHLLVHCLLTDMDSGSETEKKIEREN